MTPPKPAGSAGKVPNQPYLPGQGIPKKANPAQPGDTSGKSKYVTDLPNAPKGGSGPLNALFTGKYDASKVDEAKASKFVEQAETYKKKNPKAGEPVYQNPKKAEELYLKALEANPKDKKAIFGLIQIAYDRNDALGAHDLLTGYINFYPEDNKRRQMRIQLDTQIIQGMQANAANFKQDEIPQVQRIMGMIALEAKIDQAILMANTSEDQIKSLIELEQKLKTLHSEPLPRKLGLLRGISMNIASMVELTALPMPDQATKDKVNSEIPKIISETYGMLARFAKEDKDEKIKNLAPMYEAYQLLALGKTEEAMPFLETVRSNGFKEYGGGDEAKGKEKLKQTVESLKKLQDEKDPAKVQEGLKSLGEIPEGLIDADAILSAVEADRLKHSNLALVAAWKDKINEDFRATCDKYDGAWSVGWRAIPYGVKGVFWNIFGDGHISSPFTDAADEAGKQRDLVGAVETKLSKGEAKTVKEALEQLRDKGSGDIQARAKAQLDDTGFFSSVITYVSTPSSPGKVVDTSMMVGAAFLKGGKFTSGQSASLYALIQYQSRDADIKKSAGEGIDKDKLSYWVKQELRDPNAKPEPTTIKAETITGSINAAAD